MIFREATVQDVPQIQVVRNSVKENKLSDPSVVTDANCIDYLTKRGKGWVCEIDQKIIGFAIADLQGESIWALFIHPDYEKKGIGRKLHHTMLNWYFAQNKDQVWLSTASHTRAASFYTKAGWTKKGSHNGEFRFEMSKQNWLNLH